MASPTRTASASRGQKKRFRTSETTTGGTTSSTLALISDLPPPTKRSCSTCPILRDELSALRSDLERERDLHTLETKRSSAAESRLRRQLTLCTEEADEVRTTLDEVRARSERDVKAAREARREALRKLAAAEARVARLEANTDEEEEETRLLEEENDRLREKLEAVEEEVVGLRVELEERIEEVAAAAAVGGDAGADNTPKKEDKDDKKEDIISPAPPAVMLELSRTRIKLSEAERSNRQLQRKLTAVQSVAETAVRHKEEARATRARLDRVEAELIELRKEREEKRAVEGRWVGFREEIVKAFGGSDDADAYDSSDDDQNMDGGGVDTPPEVSTIVRKFRSLQDKLHGTERDLTKAKSDLETTTRIASVAEKRSQDAAASESALRRRLSEAERRADGIDLDLRKLRAQEDVWKREADSLRSLLETYERAEIRPPNTPSPKKTAATSDVGGEDNGPTIRGLRTSLTSAQERVRLLSEEAKTLKAEADTAKTECEAAKTELARVTEKFGKLRDALFKEREKAENAEERACRAETLAGKGSFEPNSTRVLHLKQNPLMNAVRAKYESEIEALRKALEEKEQDPSAAGSSALAASAKTSLLGRTPPSAGSAEQSALDAQKLHRRLKESFREQIGKFREGVYLLTGFKIDMISDSTPIRFKVRSMYAEREEDHLMFAWPKVRKGEERNVTMLDLLDTPQAQLLAQDSSFDYMTKYKSTPSFLASVQLGLFEKQTFAG